MSDRMDRIMAIMTSKPQTTKEISDILNEDISKISLCLIRLSSKWKLIDRVVVDREYRRGLLAYSLRKVKE